MKTLQLLYGLFALITFVGVVGCILWPMCLLAGSSVLMDLTGRVGGPAVILLIGLVGGAFTQILLYFGGIFQRS